MERKLPEARKLGVEARSGTWSAPDLQPVAGVARPPIDELRALDVDRLESATRTGGP